MLENNFKSDKVKTEKQDIEFKREIPVAEDIAKFRTEFEEKIFNKKILPRKEWQKYYQEMFKRFPKVIPFRPILDQILHNAESVNDELEKFWRTKKEEWKEDITIKEDSSVEKADGRLAKMMIFDLLGFYAKDEVQAFKGAVTIRFMLSEDDYTECEKYSSLGKTNGRFILHPYSGIRIILVKRNRLGVENMAIYHELEHAKNSILNVSRRYVLEKSPTLDRKKENLIDRRIKDEILAQTTILKPYKIIDGMTDEQTKTMIHDTFQQIAKDLVEIYLETYGKTSILYDGYVEKINSCVSAIEDLYFFYRKDESIPNPERLAINLLEQFSIKKWPAVVRLIKSKHSTK